MVSYVQWVKVKWVNQVGLYTSQAAWKPTWDFPFQPQSEMIGLFEGYTWVHAQTVSVVAKAVCWGNVFKLSFYHNATSSFTDFSGFNIVIDFRFLLTLSVVLLLLAVSNISV